MAHIDTQPPPFTHLIKDKSAISPDLKKNNNSLKDNRRSDNNKHEHESNAEGRSIPKSDNTLDLVKLGYNDNVELRKALIPLIKELLTGWDDVSHESDIQIERVSGALTNCVFFITNAKKLSDKISQKVVLRVYGNGVDQFLCDRQKELDFLRKLSTLNIGPKLLGIFSNGRFEEFLESVTLSKEDLRKPSTSRDIAKLMSQLHNIINIFPPTTKPEPQVWLNIRNWYPLALKTVLSNTFKCTEEQKEDLKEFDLESLEVEIQDLRNRLESFNSPLVFAHNDLQYGNILRLTGGDQLAVVDFEYSGINHKSFDIANHFCEWMFDYHSSEAHKMCSGWYPNSEQQVNFLQSYIDCEKDKDCISNSNYLQKLQLEVNAFALASHIMWGLWGLIQSGQSDINFNYFAYGMQRLKYFRDAKDSIYEQLSNQS